MRRLVTFVLVLALTVVPLSAATPMDRDSASGPELKGRIGTSPTKNLQPKVDCCPPVENPDPGGGEICNGGTLICWTVTYYYDEWDGTTYRSRTEQRQYCECY